ncbi:hypothetical protein DFH94DRAFT_740329 [Russula ochroleuca]|uniref:Uncharacterized protein n=1 Tax=Russula ochroleuca TaxID=152965 RepID=A0A9P5T8Q4_9AGAM|nr:hypothetical protein DFH94DRAFT_740329 [Russula ochroleuca]
MDKDGEVASGTGVDNFITFFSLFFQAEQQTASMILHCLRRAPTLLKQTQYRPKKPRPRGSSSTSGLDGMKWNRTAPRWIVDRDARQLASQLLDGPREMARSRPSTRASGDEGGQLPGFVESAQIGRFNVLSEERIACGRHAARDAPNLNASRNGRAHVSHRRPYPWSTAAAGSTTTISIAPERNEPRAKVQVKEILFIYLRRGRYSFHFRTKFAIV